MSSAPPDNVDIRIFMARYEEQARELDRLKSGDGGGISGGMEARVAKLESDMEHVKKAIDRLADVPVDLATLKAQVSNLPTTDKMRETMRNWMLMGTTLTTVAIGVLGFVLKAAGVF